MKLPIGHNQKSRRLRRANIVPASSPFSLMLRFIGSLAVLAIAILSLVPGQARPHVLSSGTLEHFFAYCITAAALTFGRREIAKSVWIALLLSVYAWSLEVMQFWIPGRSSKLSDFLVSSLGAFAGIAVASFTRRDPHVSQKNSK